MACIYRKCTDAVVAAIGGVDELASAIHLNLGRRAFPAKPSGRVEIVWSSFTAR